MTFFAVPHASIQRTKLAAAAALLAFSALNASAAIVPPGVALAAKQELVRNNGSEVETLDPALVETVVAANVSRDLFESLMKDEEHHIDFLETQLDLIKRIGLELYTQKHIGHLEGGD